MQRLLNLHESDLNIIEHIVKQMEEELGTDREAALGGYALFLHRIAGGAVCVPSP